MSIESAKSHLDKCSLSSKIIEFDESSATVELAAKALACEPAKIAKTLSFLVNDEPILIVTAGDTKIDNLKFKTVFKTKAKMIESSELNYYIGHEAGGICPFGIKDNVKVYLDMSLKRFDKVYPACGSANSAVEITIKELEENSNYQSWIDVSKEK